MIKTKELRDKDAFFCYGFLPMVLEAVRQKMNVVPYLNRSPLNIGYGFYFYDRFNPLGYFSTKTRKSLDGVSSKILL